MLSGCGNGVCRSRRLTAAPAIACSLTAALDPHTYGKGIEKKNTSNALTSLARHAAVAMMAGAALGTSAATAAADPADDASFARPHALGFTFTPDRNETRSSRWRTSYITRPLRQDLSKT